MNDKWMSGDPETMELVDDENTRQTRELMDKLAYAPEEKLKTKAREIATQQYHEDGHCEIDTDAKVSLSYEEETGEVQGAYVQAWVWVDLPKETREIPVVFGNAGIPKTLAEAEELLLTTSPKYLRKIAAIKELIEKFKRGSK